MRERERWKERERERCIVYLFFDGHSHICWLNIHIQQWGVHMPTAQKRPMWEWMLLGEKLLNDIQIHSKFTQRKKESILLNHDLIILCWRQEPAWVNECVCTCKHVNPKACSCSHPQWDWSPTFEVEITWNKYFQTQAGTVVFEYVSFVSLVGVRHCWCMIYCISPVT